MFSRPPKSCSALHKCVQSFTYGPIQKLTIEFWRQKNWVLFQGFWACGILRRRYDAPVPPIVPTSASNSHPSSVGKKFKLSIAKKIGTEPRDRQTDRQTDKQRHRQTPETRVESYALHRTRGVRIPAFLNY